MRIVRAMVGALLVLLAVPLLIGGAGLWEAARHRDAGGAFEARTEPIRTVTAAVVVWDLDALLRREAPFARGGNTVLRIDAPGRFVGLGPRSAVAAYLGDAARLTVSRVRLARGPLPVDASVSESDQAGSAPLGAPADQPFWRLHSTPERYRPLVFPPSALRGRQLALVIMNPDATPGIDGAVTVAVTPRWLDQTSVGVLLLGAVLLLLGTVALAWPRPRRDVVYVVEPARVPELTARLGLPIQPLPPGALPVTALPVTALPVTALPVSVSPVSVSPTASVAATSSSVADPLLTPPVTMRLEWPPAPSAELNTPAPVPAAE
jgi:hypothetical protein